MTAEHKNGGAPVSEAEKFLSERVVLRPGDSRDVLRMLPDASIDSCVTDPPYALVSIGKRFGAPGAAPAVPKEGAAGAYARASAGFMGQTWDTGEVAFAVEFWAEVYRVLKPGAHLVAFSATRTYHRMVCAIEDAGFEIRDQLAWAYGTGFPKSHNVGKAIDKHLGFERAKVPVSGAPTYQRDAGNHRPWMDDPNHMVDSNEPATAEAAEWNGWGTALKPAWEPIVLARKPLAGTVAGNVLEFGTGALHIDACRIEMSDAWGASGEPMGSASGTVLVTGVNNSGRSGSHSLGRYPANIVHDGSAEVLAAFPESGSGSSTAPRPVVKRASGCDAGGKASAAYGAESRPAGSMVGIDRGDTGSAARFFYSAKADAEDRLGSKHPTVKPVDLMQWLCRLVTPRGGIILDPFAGTGTTGEAAWREGFRAVLIEREPQFQNDIRRRMRLADTGPDERRRERIKASGKAEAPESLPLFGSASR